MIAGAATTEDFMVNVIRQWTTIVTIPTTIIGANASVATGVVIGMMVSRNAATIAGRDWRYYQGRYWAPAQYRGRHCTDRRHYHGVHYHVAARDYYDYYYPRYRYYGSRPLGANASVIITAPLF